MYMNEDSAREDRAPEKAGRPDSAHSTDRWGSSQVPACFVLLQTNTWPKEKEDEGWRLEPKRVTCFCSSVVSGVDRPGEASLWNMVQL